MNPSEYGVHRTHCCRFHGCKYGDEDCPVVNDQIDQDYICESCDERGITPTLLMMAQSQKLSTFSLQEDELLVLMELSGNFPQLQIKLEALLNKTKKWRGGGTAT